MFKVYLTDRIDALYNEEFVGEFCNHEEAFRQGLAAYRAKGYHEEPYTRGLLCSDGDYYDLGSYCHFLAIIYPH
jgi:hypothetical protein